MEKNVLLRHLVKPAAGAYSSMRFLVHGVREGVWWAKAAGKRAEQAQSPAVWNLGSDQDFLSTVGAAGARVQEGRYAWYVPPQSGLPASLRNILQAYPPGCGLKILKDARPPSDANYVGGSSGAAVRRLLNGTPADQVVTCNRMWALGLAPRVWDLCEIRAGHLAYTAFVVEHAGDGAPSQGACEAFIRELQTACQNADLVMTHPSWDVQDFRCPDCNQNLVADRSGRAVYVDFQNFTLRHRDRWTADILRRSSADLHFGDVRAARGGRYLYQSVPGHKTAGKRNTDRRWSLFEDVFQRHDLSFENRLVLDVGCNSGMMLYGALARGAFWGLGWDRPRVVEPARDLLLSLGATRFNLQGAALHAGYPLSKDVPPHLRSRLEESVVLFLSVREHVGMMQELASIPWRVLIYEGHQYESKDDAMRHVSEVLARGEQVVHKEYIGDGDSTKRPILVITRTEAAEVV